MNNPILKLEWNDGMSVGIPKIDEDHKQFISQINGLNRSITEGIYPAEIKSRLQFIIDDAKRHFDHEEKLFQEWQYPYAEKHALTHIQALKDLQRIHDAFIPDDLDSEWADAGCLLKSILIVHILTEDMKYADFYKSRNYS